MDSDTELVKVEEVVEVVFEAEVESSEDPPMDQWSSLFAIGTEEYNPKKILYEQGLYDPGTGDMCPEYIAMSASSVLRHPYYHYPAIKDPGIRDALLEPEEPVIYPDDGQEHYLALCDQMNECPVKIFYKGLVESVIDLKYYGVSSRGVRAMSLALRYNRFVTIINLTDNFLSVDACFHLGEMLGTNNTLVELNLTGCRIGPQGFQMLLANLHVNRRLSALGVGGNELGDSAMTHLGNAVFQGLGIKMINLSNNNITGKGLNPLTEAFETRNNFTHWNLAWNNLYSPGTYNFLIAILESTKFVKKMDLSWNSLAGLRVAQGIRGFLSAKGLKHINLSNNRLEGEAIKTILNGLAKALKLLSINFSYNPMSVQDAILVLTKVKPKNVKVLRVYMEGVNVSPEFMELLAELKQAKPKMIITHGSVVGGFVAVGPDPRELVLNRMDFLCRKAKKSEFDMALFVLQLEKEKVGFMLMKDLMYALKIAGAPPSEDLLDEMVYVFRGPGTGQARTINIPLLVDYVKRKYPDKKLPPTPPPEPEPEPVPEKGKGKGKDKGKGKK
ncbi:uncharacterized protein LOC142987819 [Anticarsia gemmatalis]|uniref:uncharacterized protein LOC142987819 n=1 Tax=Anticarsia gemmatalis TaxID=129554 RepID=UPI003F76935A